MYAANGVSGAADLVLLFLKNLSRSFVSSDYIRLEVLPKSVCHGNVAEMQADTQNLPNRNGFHCSALNAIETLY